MRASRPPAKLLRILGGIFGAAVVVGSMVGQGILRTPGIIAGAVHSPSLILLLWLVGGGLAAISAFAYVELGAAIPCAGGPYDFVRHAFGPLPGIVAGWGAWFVLLTGEAFLAIVTAEFLQRLGILPQASTSVVAASSLALFSLLNWTGTRISGDSQVIFSALKGAALIALVVVLLAHPTNGHSSMDTAQAAGLAGVAFAMRAIYNTYDGWTDIVYFGEEIEKPAQNLPRSMAAGIVTVTVIYVSMNVALLHVLSPGDMAGSPLPAADAAKLVFGVDGDFMLTLLGLLSVSAILNLTIMKSARVGFALARAGYLPSKLSAVASSGTPRPALIVCTLAAFTFTATGTYLTVVAMNVVVSAALVAVVNFAAIRLRMKEPKLYRPFQMPLFPVPAIIAIIVNLALVAALIFEDPTHSFEGFALLGLIGGIYAALPRLRARMETSAI